MEVEVGDGRDQSSTRNQSELVEQALFRARSGLYK